MDADDRARNRIIRKIVGRRDVLIVAAYPAADDWQTFILTPNGPIFACVVAGHSTTVDTLQASLWSWIRRNYTDIGTYAIHVVYPVT